MARSQTFANLIEKAIDLIDWQPGVPYKLTLSNSDFVARLATLSGNPDFAQSEQARAMLASYMSNLGYVRRVPDPTGKNRSLDRSGHYEMEQLGFEFKNSVGPQRAKMKKDLIRKLAANAAKRQTKKPSPSNAALPQLASVAQVPAIPTPIPNVIEIKMPEGNVISAPATPENRRKVADFFIGQG